MALETFSKFYYGYTITSDNQNLNFDEGSGELVGQVLISAYTLTDLIVALKTAMDAAGTQEYTVSVDRETRRVTISATSNFDLLLSTGSQVGTSPWVLLGFTQASDLTGTNTYTGDGPAGSVYYNQFKIQDYVGPEKLQQRIDASVNESASGVIEVISFGIRKRIEMDLMYITNLPQDGKVIKSNPTGVEDAQDFLQFLITRAPLEFMPDIDTSNTFFKVQLEKTAKDGKGVGYLLREEVGKNLKNYFTTGKLTFRVIT